MMWIIISIVIVALDQVTKMIVLNNIEPDGAIIIIDKFFFLTNIRNKGAAWSILQNGRYFLITMTIIASVIIIYFLFKSSSKLLKLSLSITLGGAVGNLIDRVIVGSVVDFLDFNFGSYHFPVFNAADASVVVGTIILAYYMLFVYKEHTANA